MWVKICGNTNLEDAAMAAELGADAVGFVFAQGKRQVTAAQVAAITSRLSAGVERVGVFDSSDAEQIARTASVAGLNAVQLHGGLDDKLLEQLVEKLADGVRLIQTLHWVVETRADQGNSRLMPGSSAEPLIEQIQRIAKLGLASRVLIDSKVGAAAGGTGVAYDWNAARSLFASASSSVKVIVAGGLKPGNVADAIQELAPWGVDVSSGVETSPGRKDPALVKLFIENARGPKTP
jgi:phosphoribosylanthranilate isomerase